MLPPQAEKMECPGEIAGCVARFEALDLNHAMASQLSQNGSSKTTSSQGGTSNVRTGFPG